MVHLIALSNHRVPLNQVSILPLLISIDTALINESLVTRFHHQLIFNLFHVDQKHKRLLRKKRLLKKILQKVG